MGGPRQSIHVVHDKNSARFPKLYYPERWDAIYEGAPVSMLSNPSREIQSSDEQGWDNTDIEWRNTTDLHK